MKFFNPETGVYENRMEKIEGSYIKEQMKKQEDTAPKTRYKSLVIIVLTLIALNVLAMFQLGYMSDAVDVLHRISATPDPLPGTTRTFDGIEFVWISLGAFTMGSPSSEIQRHEDELQHEVTISEGFWLGKYEMTQYQWRKVMGSNPSRFTGDTNAVEQVSWNTIQGYLQKLNGGSNSSPYRLPTEAEWEYACRAGTSGPFHYGSSLSSTNANFDRNFPYGVPREDTFSKTKRVPVGNYSPNAWGLYDMHGNMLEWCSDRYGEYPTDSVNGPTGPEAGNERVLRGGAWRYNGARCRSAFRFSFSPDFRAHYIGFRLVRNKK